MPEQTDDEPRPDIESDDENEEPKPRKVGTRRVAGWSTSDRLLARHHRRPAGNSRSFWSRIEEDDPFARRRARQARNLSGEHDLYPSQRLSRVEDGRVVSSRPVSRPPPRPRDEPPTPKREAKRRAEPPPRSEHRQEEAPRSAPRPGEPTPETAAAPPIDRRPPLIRQGHKSKSGRMRVSRSTKAPPPDSAPVERKSASEIREEKLAARSADEPPEPPDVRGLDNVLGLLGELAAASSVFDENQKRKKRGDELLPEAVVNHDPRPGPEAPPKAKKKSKSKSSPPPRAKTHAKKQEPVDPTPPAKPKKKSDASAHRSPSSGGMDDIFGGGPQEGRVRIGKRTKKK